jgi:hypothetical protein
MLLSEFAKTLPNVSLAAVLSEYDFDTFGFDPVAETPFPTVTEYQTANYLGAVQQPDGSWAQGWEVVDKSAEEKAAIDADKAKATREEAKRVRQELVDAITVTVGDKVFDGDETSQNRMARAILALESAGQPTTKWTLNNNDTVDVTVDELKQALQLAGQAQTDIWVI